MLPEGLHRFALHLQVRRDVPADTRRWHGQGSRELSSRRYPTAATRPRSCDAALDRVRSGICNAVPQRHVENYAESDDRATANATTMPKAADSR